MTVTLYGGIEGGGTKFVCVVGSGPDDIRAITSFPTTSAHATVPRAIAFFQEHAGRVSLTEAPPRSQDGAGGLGAIGVGMFGPVDLRVGSPEYGHVLHTPKHGWSGADILGPLRLAFDVPLVLDTDVNAAALGEWRWGAGRDCDPVLYVTVGTGIGGGVVVGGRPLHGLLHPEMGHVTVRRHPHDPASFPGICPFHGDCLEGMASGPAIERRWGLAPRDLPREHPAWDLEAYYLAQALTTYIYCLSPERLVIGGGVMRARGLLGKVREQVRAMLGGYIESKLVGERIDGFLVSPRLGDRAGVLGALALAGMAGPIAPF